ncbi:hypothetical protein AAMO2058_000960500 [Amorphochlora amoebiformis]
MAPVKTGLGLATKWESTNKGLANGKKINAKNSLWISFFHAEKLYEQEVCHAVVETLFKEMTSLEVILYALPSNTKPYAPFTEGGIFVEIGHDSKTEGEAEVAASTPRIFLVDATQYRPQLTIRIARVEDHDDLVPIFDRQTQVLTKDHGEYYLTKIINAQNVSNKVLVGEVSGNPVGLMGLTSDIDVKILSDCFDLKAFNHLYKPREPTGANKKEEMKKKKEKSTNTALTNAVCITMFCLDKAHEGQELPFLLEAFRLFPDIDYCILTIPHISPEIKLLENFTYIQPLPSNVFSHSLYLVHRASIHGGEISVRWSTKDDLKAFKSLLNSLDNRTEILEAAATRVEAQAKQLPVNRPINACFTVVFNGEAAGMVVLNGGEARDISTLYSEYAVHEIVPQKKTPPNAHATILYYICDPSFATKKREILLDILCKFGKKVLHYRVHPGDHVQDILDVMLQISPRKIPAPSSYLPSLDYEENGTKQMSSRHNFAVFCTTSRLLNNPRVNLNARIVVVGATSTALSFVSKILLDTRANLRSLTIITARGIEEKDCSLTGFFPVESDFNQTRLNRLAFAARVKVVQARLSRVDCKRKVVILTYGKVVPYDYLVLAPGLQDQTPEKVTVISQQYLDDQRRKAEERKRAEEAANQEMKELGYQPEENPDDDDNQEKDEEEEVGPDEPPAEEIKGVFSVKDNGSSESFLEFVDENSKSAPSVDQRTLRILIYGSTTTAVTVIRGLINRGFKAESIFWLREKSRSTVVPKGIHRLNMWHGGNPRIETHVLMKLHELGIKLLGEGEIRTVRHDRGTLMGVHFMPSKVNWIKKFPKDVKMLESESPEQENLWYFPCGALLCCGNPDVSPNIFDAVRQNSFVYDGRLVVNRFFETHDPHVLAAGTIARFSRREGKHLPIECFNPMEVGEVLAERIVDSFLCSDPYKNSRVPNFRRPKARVAIYPGEINFFHCHLPAYTLEKEKGKVMEDDRPQKYYQLVFNDSGTLECFSYYGEDVIDVKKMACLLGLPHTYMNGIFDQAAKQNKDVVEFLHATWSMALFHDQFQKERQMINHIMFEWASTVLNDKENKQDRETVKELVGLLKKGQNEDQLEHIVDKIPVHQKKIIQRRLVTFLRDNKDHLPYV